MTIKSPVRFNVQQGWYVLIADMGIDAVSLLKLARLPTDLFQRADATLSADEYFALWHALEKLADHERIPLLVGQHVSVEAFDPPVFAALCSPNLSVAYERLSQYKRLIGPMVLTPSRQPGQFEVSVACYGYSQPLPKSVALSELVFLLALARIGTRHAIKPLAVSSPLLPEDCGPYDDYFGVSIEQSSNNRMVFSIEDAERPFITHNLGMWRYFEHSLKQHLETLEPGHALSERVSKLLLELLPSGQASAESVAAHLAMSKRTLQRKLTDEGRPFRQLLQQTRQQLARHYLNDPALTTGEISFLLGFADVNSFIRAFQQWTGQAPGYYRSSVDRSFASDAMVSF